MDRAAVERIIPSPSEASSKLYSTPQLRMRTVAGDTRLISSDNCMPSIAGMIVPMTATSNGNAAASCRILLTSCGQHLMPPRREQVGHIFEDRFFVIHKKNPQRHDGPIRVQGPFPRRQR